MLNDLRYGWRVATSRLPSTFVAAAILAIGIGASTAVFTVADRILLRPLPYPRPSEIVVLSQQPVRYGQSEISVDPDVAGLEAFASVGFYISSGVNIGTGSVATRVRAAAVTSKFFDVFAVRPILGRTYRDREDGRQKLAVIGHAVWQNLLGADPAIINRAIRINGQSFQVVGVMPPQFAYPDGAQVWLPSLADPQLLDTAFTRVVVARLKADATKERATEGLEALFRSQFGSEVVSRMARPLLTPLHERINSAHRATLIFVASIVGVLLLAGCVSVGSLLLTRLEERTQELRLRRMLGARFVHLARQIVCESLWVAAGGATVGCLIALWGTRFALASLPAFTELAVELDARVVLIAAGIIVTTWLLVSFVPLAAVSLNVNPNLVRTGWHSRRTGLWGATLVVGEMALALVLVATASGAALVLLRLNEVDLGFKNSTALMLEMSVPTYGERSDHDTDATLARIERRLTAIPGVRHVGFSEVGPGTRRQIATTPLTLDPRPIPTAQGLPPVAQLLSVTDGYFRALGVPQIAGRPFNSYDRRGNPRVAIVTDAAAKQLGLDPDTIIGTRLPMGQQIWGGTQLAATYFAEVVGVVGNTRLNGPIAKETPQVYEPLSQTVLSGDLVISLDISGEADRVVTAVRDALREIVPDVPISRVSSVADLQETYLANERLAAFLASLSATIALALCVMALYGLLSQQVRQRSREFGIRLAMGADPKQLHRSILGSALRLTVAGIFAGVVLLAIATGTLIHFVPLFETAEWTTTTLAAATIAAAALISAVVPARRALKMDPASLLRMD